MNLKRELERYVAEFPYAKVADFLKRIEDEDKLKLDKIEKLISEYKTNYGTLYNFRKETSGSDNIIISVAKLTNFQGKSFDVEEYKIHVHANTYTRSSEVYSSYEVTNNRYEVKVHEYNNKTQTLDTWENLSSDPTKFEKYKRLCVDNFIKIQEFINEEL